MVCDILSQSHILLNSLRLLIVHVRIPINCHVPEMAIHYLAEVCTVSWLIDLTAGSSEVFGLRSAAAIILLCINIDAVLSINFVKSSDGELAEAKFSWIIGQLWRERVVHRVINLRGWLICNDEAMILLRTWLSLGRWSLEAVPALLCCIYRCPWHYLGCIRRSRNEVLPRPIDTQHLRVASILIIDLQCRCRRSSLIHCVKTALRLSIVLDGSKFLLILLDLHNIRIQSIGGRT